MIDFINLARECWVETRNKSKAMDLMAQRLDSEYSVEWASIQRDWRLGFIEQKMRQGVPIVRGKAWEAKSKVLRVEEAVAEDMENYPFYKGKYKRPEWLKAMQEKRREEIEWQKSVGCAEDADSHAEISTAE